ncbi:unnamed protein product [Lepeophtheirus salmonis]|uniref:(salmon louse) hypothetical protein n=1 Tax=Lepeophtheirus salmonis TaxID=72036 RepID=A0A7R8H5N7_LEPSM|nr:unnamed protein product [Lepeophtheirus salmonis]CAF2883946.1 unnamed protein product [Lepeophtheirus salmonis]
MDAWLCYVTWPIGLQHIYSTLVQLQVVVLYRIRIQQHIIISSSRKGASCSNSLHFKELVQALFTSTFSISYNYPTKSRNNNNKNEKGILPYSMSQLLHVKSLTLLFSLSFLISDLPFSLCKRDDEDFDYGEEEMTGEVPRFVVHDETIMAKQYDDVSFNCEVDKLREYDIIFKEDPKSNKMISMGDKIILSEYLDRIKLVRLSEKRGMTLILKNVTTADTGIYTCLLNHPLKNNTVTFDLTVEEESVFSKISSEGVTGGGTSHLQEASFSSCLLILLNISFIFCFNLYSSLILY